MIGALRAYSTNAVGYVRTVGNNTVSVLAPAAKSQLDILAKLKKDARPQVFEKIKSAILFEQLNATNRDLVFKPSKASTLESNDSPLYFDMTLGDKSERVELQPRKYLGPPSKQDFRVIVSTSSTADDVSKAVQYLHECLKSKDLGQNFERELANLALERAAAAGNYQFIYHKLTANLTPFKPLLRQDFYATALRIYALRVPYLSVRSKNMLNRLYRQSSTGLSRELAYAYGLTQFKNKFGEQYMGHLKDSIQRIKEMLSAIVDNSRVHYKTISLTDLVLGHEAMTSCGLPESQEVAESLSKVITKWGRHRPLTETLVVKMSEQDIEAGNEAENNQAEEKEE